MVQPGEMHAGHSVHCDACGGHIALVRLAEVVTCPHCGHQQRLDPQRVRALQGYEQGVRADADHARAELELAARWQAQHASIKTPALQYVLGIGLMMGFPLVFIGIGVALMKAGVLDERTGGPWIGIGGVLAGGVGAALYGLSSLVLAKARGKKAGQVGMVRVACANCGAPGELAPGNPVGRCAHCGAAVLPSQAAVDDATARTRRAARLASLERMRRERDVVVGYQGYALQGPTIALLAGGPLMLLSGGFAFVSSVQMLMGIEPFDAAILGLWALFFIVTGVLVAALAWGWHRRRTVRTAIDTLASSLQGHRLDGVKDTAWWLNTYWAGSYPNDTLVRSDYHGAVSAVVDGYRTLVEFSPEADRYHKARLHVLVAAWLPLVTDGTGRPAASAQASAAHGALVETGFTVEHNAGGLMLRATPAALETLSKKPSRVAEMGRVVRAAVLMARGLGAEPV